LNCPQFGASVEKRLPHVKQFTLSFLGSGLLLSVGVVVRIVVVDLEINIFKKSNQVFNRTRFWR
jgi:hypothetical protein